MEKLRKICQEKVAYRNSPFSGGSMFKKGLYMFWRDLMQAIFIRQVGKTNQ